MSQQTKISYHVRQLPQKAADIFERIHFGGMQNIKLLSEYYL